MNALINTLMRHRLVVLALILLGTAFFGFQLLKVELNGDFSTYLSRTDPAVQQFNLIGEQYAGKSIGLVIVESDDIFTTDTLQLIRSLTDAFEKAEGVAYVTSLTNVLDFRKTEGGLEVGRLIQRNGIPTSADELSGLRNYVLSRDMYVGDLVSADAKSTVIVVRIMHGASEMAVTSDIRRIAEGIATDTERISYGGLPFMMNTLTGLIVLTMERLEPLMLLLMVAILYLGFRRLGGVVMPLLVVGVSTVWAVGLMAMLGISLNMVTGIMPVVLIALGSADAIHVMRRYYEGRQAGQDVAVAMRETFRDLKWALVVTTVTTSVGFLSLLVSDFSVIQQFGLVTTLAVFLALAVTVALIPALLSFSRAGTHRRPTRGAGIGTVWMERAAGVIYHHKGWVLATAGVIALAAVAATPLLSTSVDWTLCFARGSKAERAEMLLRRDFGGTLPIQVLVKGDIEDPAAQQVLSDLEHHLDALPMVNESKSMASLLSEMNWVLNDRYIPPKERAGVANLWFLIENEDAVEQLVREDRREGLVQARIATWDTGVISRSVEAVNRVVAELPRRLVAVDLEQVPAGVQSRLLALQGERITENLLRDLAERQIEVPNEALTDIVTAAVAADQLDDSARTRVREVAARYLVSEQAEVVITSPRAIQHLASAAAKAAGLRGAFDREAVSAAARRLAPDSDPEDRRALLDSLAWIAAEAAGQARVDAAKAAITSLLPPESLGLRGLQRELAGDLWLMNAQRIPLAVAESERLGVGGTPDASAELTLSYEVSGLANVLKKMEQELTPTQVWSLLIALVGVAVLLALMFRSVVAGLIGIVPIGLTILVNFGVMAVLGVGLDSFTAMVASVAIGLGVDYAVHFLSSYQRELAALRDELDALRRTFATTGMAIVINTFTVGVGFAVLLLAPGQHVQRFGGLVALTMFLGALFTLAVLPAITLLLKPTFLRRSGDEHTVLPIHGDLAGSAADGASRLGTDRG